MQNKLKHLPLIISLCLQLTHAHSRGVSKTIYGSDDREDISANTPTKILELSKAVFTMVAESDLGKGRRYGHKFRKVTYKKRYGLCENENFSDQRVLGNCSGFLIAPDIVVTAGHCLPTIYSCSFNKFVFNFDLKASQQKYIQQDNVYSCKTILKREHDESKLIDYAIIKLDRPVVGVTPLKINTNRSSVEGDAIFMIGSPHGLPLKVAYNAKILEVWNNVFLSDLDSFTANSGSPVFNSRGEVESILTMGALDLRWDKENRCNRIVKCKTRDRDSDYCVGNLSFKLDQIDFEEIVTRK